MSNSTSGSSQAGSSQAGSLREMMGRAAPHRTAVRYSDGKMVDYACLASAADHVADRFPGGAGGSVGLCLADPVALIAWTTGLLASGTSVFLTHPDLPAAELNALAEHESAVAVVTDRTRIPGQFTPVDAPTTADEVLAVRDVPRRPVCREPAAHFYTSGTSGRRKGAIRPEPTLVREAESIAGSLGFDAGSRVLCAVPLCHAYGFADGVLAVLAAGATLIAVRPGSSGQLAEALRWSRADVLVGVPALYDLWTRGTANGLRDHRLRLCVSAGAPLSPTVAARFEDRWGVRISQQYGMTECGAISIDTEGTDGSVGRPFPGVEVRLDAAGEIVVASSFAATGYVAGVHELLPRNPFSPDGLLTGDLGRFDGRGRLHVTGRREEFINVHGEKVDPGEVEDVLRSHPAVRDAAVVGVPTTSGDQWVAAFVVCDDAVGERELTDHCTSLLVRYKAPRRMIRLPELPRTALGKIRRTALVDLLTPASSPGR
jgi:acyl-coenzyme A synthetase/AMP-(fatty) acid ligase